MEGMAADQAADITKIVASLPHKSEEDSDESLVVLTKAEKKIARKHTQTKRKEAAEKKTANKGAARKHKREDDLKAKSCTLPPQRVSPAFPSYPPTNISIVVLMFCECQRWSSSS